MKKLILFAVALFIVMAQSAHALEVEVRGSNAVTGNVQDIDAGKLKFLSCNPFKNDPMATSKELSDWVRNLYLTNARKNTSGNGMTMPIELNGKYLMNGACIENIKVYLGPNAAVIQGEVCNRDLNDFRSALASVGIQLSGGSVFSKKELPTKISSRVIASSKDATRQLYKSYIVIEGGLDVKKMETIPIKNKYSFFCEQ